MICKINYGLWAMVWAGLDYEIKGSRPIITNFWGPFFSLFRGKKIFYNLFENTVVSAMKSCIIPFYNSFFFSKKFQVLKTANNVIQILTFFSRLNPAIPISATRSRCMTVRSERSGSIYSSCLWQSANNRNNFWSHRASFLINRPTKNGVCNTLKSD